MTKSLKILLNEELGAWRYRFKYQFKKPEPSLAESFRNWTFISHYFYLYRILFEPDKKRGNWLDFFTWVHKNSNWLAETVRAHLGIANSLPPSVPELTPDRLNIETDQIYFFGFGTVTGEIGDAYVKRELLVPTDICKDDSPGIILTRDGHLLSQGFLEAIARRIPVVGNIPEDQWQKLQPGRQLKVDFENKLIQVI